MILLLSHYGNLPLGITLLARGFVRIHQNICPSKELPDDLIDCKIQLRLIYGHIRCVLIILTLSVKLCAQYC